jgi:hypothetical protein
MDLQGQKDKFFEQLKTGESCYCPLCERHAKIYRRKIHASMAKALLEVLKLGGDAEYFHYSVLTVPALSGDFAKLVHWGLIQQKPDCLGFWLVTEKGVEFAKKQTTVPKYVFLWEGVPMKYSDEQVNIIQALGDKYSYSEIMTAFPI